MAKGTATCKCEKCGKTFQKSKVCFNRREADSWEEWAEEYYTICPDCYAAQKAEEMEEKYEIREMHYGEYKNNFFECKTVPNSYNSKTKTIKVYVPREASEPISEESSVDSEKSSTISEKEDSKTISVSSEQKDSIRLLLNKILDAFICAVEGKEKSRNIRSVRKSIRGIRNSGDYDVAEIYYWDKHGNGRFAVFDPQMGVYKRYCCWILQGSQGDSTWIVDNVPGGVDISKDVLLKIEHSLNGEIQLCQKDINGGKQNETL